MCRLQYRVWHYVVAILNKCREPDVDPETLKKIMKKNWFVHIWLDALFWFRTKENLIRFLDQSKVFALKIISVFDRAF